jgi:hypothetical protein
MPAAPAGSTIVPSEQAASRASTVGRMGNCFLGLGLAPWFQVAVTNYDHHYDLKPLL